MDPAHRLTMSSEAMKGAGSDREGAGTTGEAVSVWNTHYQRHIREDTHTHIKAVSSNKCLQINSVGRTRGDFLPPLLWQKNGVFIHKLAQGKGLCIL